VSYEVGEKVQALWTDGKWYEGIVKKIVAPGPEGKYAVTYTAYGNTATLTAKQLKKAAPAAAAGAGAGASAAKPAAAAAAAGAGGKAAGKK